MGNWRRVRIVGTCDAAEVPTLREAIRWRYFDDPDDRTPIHCLMHSGGICGLPNWAAESIDAVGNLFERDYHIESVADALEQLLKVAPSLRVKIHVGGDYEDEKCIGTVETVETVAVKVHAPQVETIPSISADQMIEGIHQQLTKARRL